MAENWREPHLAAVPPTVNDDASLGFRTGSLWVDRVARRAYVLVDSAVGAALWNALGLANLPIGSVYWELNAVATPIITQSTWTRIAPVAGTLATPAKGFDRPANGRLRNIDGNVDVLVSAALSMASAAPNDVYVIAVWKNGTVNANGEYITGNYLPGSRIRMKVGGAGDALSSAVTGVDVSLSGDYYEIAIQNMSSVADPTIINANLVVGGHPS